MHRPIRALSLLLRFPVVAALVAGVAMPGPMAAQPDPAETRAGGRWFQQRSGETAAAERLAVRARGDVIVIGSDVDAIRYSSRIWVRTAVDGLGLIPAMLDREHVESERVPDGWVRIVLQVPECAGCRVAAALQVEVPRDISQIDLETRGGDIEVRNIEGSVKALAAGGSVDMDTIGSDVNAVASGRIVLGAVGGSVTCETAGGRIELDRAAGSARLATDVGSVRAMSVAGDLDARTGAGSIEIGRVKGSVSAETSSGSIRVIEAFNGVRAQAGAGDIRIGRASGALSVTSGAGNIAVGLAEQARLLDSVLTTGVGSVQVFLPETLALTIEAAVEMFRGHHGILTEFPSIQVSRSRGVIGTARATGSINGGGPTLRSGTGIGHIEFRRQR